MSNISLTFVAHQPNRLIHYDFFKIGEHAFYEDDDLNARVLSTVAERCYFPATRLMKQLIELTGGKFRFGLALSGVILEQALYHRPDLIAAFWRKPAVWTFWQCLITIPWHPFTPLRNLPNRLKNTGSFSKNSSIRKRMC